MPLSELTGEELMTLLSKADRRTLAAVVTHLSGDPNAILDLADRDHIERKAAEILPPFIEGERQPPVPDDELLQAAMDLAVGAPVPAEYRTYVREQTGIGPVEPLEPINAPADFKILVVGAGATGIVVARRLHERGIENFTVAEANPSPGGAWWTNTYPGCRVDTPSLLYSFSFHQDPGWPEHFSPQPALLSYLRGVVQDSGFDDKVQVNTEVRTLHWDENAALWRVGFRRPDGTTGTTDANAVILAPGLLRIPKYPAISGQDTFAGPSWHSARWNHNVDLSGLRVAVIGTGASAQQIVPAIAPIAGQVVVYQRSPQWLLTHEKYGRKLTGRERELYERIPMYRQWNRFSESWRFGDGTTPFITVDPNWDKPGSISKDNERLRNQLLKYIDEQIGDRPDLVKLVTPDYPPFTKRMLIDNGWYRALRRDNVRLNASRIDEITPTGVRTADGEDELDVIIYATGFQADHYLLPMQVTGAGGVDVTARLDADPKAYLGLALEDCPNLFLTPGPTAYLGHAGNAMFFAECHARYITECLRMMFARGARSMAPRPAAIRSYTESVRAGLANSVWNQQGVDSWFKGDRQEIVTIAAESVIGFWTQYRSVDEEAYELGHVGTSGDADC
jgi:4-hydroxyacetophenone monooxygenase